MAQFILATVTRWLFGEEKAIELGFAISSSKSAFTESVRRGAFLQKRSSQPCAIYSSSGSSVVPVVMSRCHSTSESFLPNFSESFFPSAQR